MAIYQVIGNYNGKKINTVVDASSKKQAKLRAGFKNGFGGNEMGGFMKSTKVKVRRKR
jgi:hypothetical protein